MLSHALICGWEIVLPSWREPFLLHDRLGCRAHGAVRLSESLRPVLSLLYAILFSSPTIIRLICHQPYCVTTTAFVIFGSRMWHLVHFQLGRELLLRACVATVGDGKTVNFFLLRTMSTAALA